MAENEKEIEEKLIEAEAEKIAKELDEARNHAQKEIEEIKEARNRVSSKEYKTCPFCGTSNNIKSTYCKSCGRDITKQIKCNKCGTVNPVGSKFCGNCGKSFFESKGGVKYHVDVIGDKESKTEKIKLNEEQKTILKILQELGYLGEKIPVRWEGGSLVRLIEEEDQLHINRVVIGIGPEKNNTRYPVDSIKFVYDKNNGLLCYFYSPKLKSPNYPLNNKKINGFIDFMFFESLKGKEIESIFRLVISSRSTFDATRQKAPPMIKEPKLSGPAPERKLLPIYNEPKQLTTGQKLITEGEPGPYPAEIFKPKKPEEQKLLPEGKPKGLLPPAKRSFQEPEIRKWAQEPEEKFTVTVDSWPMREVHVGVERKISITTKLPLSELEGILKGSFTQYDAPRKASLILNILIPQFISNHFTDENTAREWLKNNITSQNINITDPNTVDDVVDKIIKYYFKKQWRTLDWIRDEWNDATENERRSGAVHPIDFNLRRETGYLYFEDSNLVIDKNTFTVFYLEVPKGKCRFTAEKTVKIKNKDGTESQATFEKWDIYREGFEAVHPNIKKDERYLTSFRQGVMMHWDPELEIDIDENIKIVAFYKASASLSQRPKMRSPYQEGAMGGYGRRGYLGKDSAVGALGTNPFQRNLEKARMELGEGRFGSKRMKIGKESEYKGLSAEQAKVANSNPLFRAATNKGKRILNKYARAEYTRIFTPLKRDYASRKTQLENLKNQAKTARAHLRSVVRQQRGWLRSKGQTDHDLVNRANDSLQPGGNLEGDLALQQQRDTLQNFLNARENFEKDFKRDLESASAHLISYLTEKAENVSIQVSRRYKIALNSDLEGAINAELKSYAQELAENFIARGRTWTHAVSRFLSSVSRSSATAGDIWYNILSNIKEFILGPWVLGAIVVLLQFFFILSWVAKPEFGPYYLFVWVAPAIGAIGVFVLNFESLERSRPFDWLTHLVAGAMIAYTTIIFLVALGFDPAYLGLFWFAFIWFILAWLVGAWQFYQSGGFRVVLTVTIVIMLFGYVALGPYHYVWDQVKEQVKVPLKIAYRAIRDAFYNVWLLATDPTSWYARQQVVNVRPEKPISMPKGIEIVSFDALPSSVPAESEFAMTAIIRNDGDLDATVTEARVGCNKWCEEREAEVRSQRMLFRKDGNINVPLTDTKSSPLFEKGMGDTITIRPLKAITESGRSAEVHLAKVNFSIVYRTNTSSSLFVEVMNQNEIDRRFRESQDVYKNVVAVSKVSPAQLSLNVGPQPLTAGKKSNLLLVSVSNARPDGNVILRIGDKIIINMPPEVGTFEGDDTGAKCRGQVSCVFAGNQKIECTLTPEKDIEIRQYEFNSIFSFLCEFTTSPESAVGTSKTGLITASLPKYEFSLNMEKNVPVTAPLGIIITGATDANERYCIKNCGRADESRFIANVFNPCDKPECYKVKPPEGTCWFLETVPLGRLGECHACSTFDCERMLRSDECTEQATRCDKRCKWLSASDTEELEKRNLLTPAAGGGYCVSEVVGAAAETTASCPSGNPMKSYENEYNKYAAYIDAAVKQNNLNIENPKALVAALITQESLWNERAYRNEPQINDASYGLMQIVPSYHPECNTAKIKAYDIEESINCGVKYLSDNLKECGTVEKALIKYNSGNCNGKTFDAQYVNKIYSNSNSNYNNWKACIKSKEQAASGTTLPSRTSFGSAGYCAWLKDNTENVCGYGMGGCYDYNECDQNVEEINPSNNQHFKLQCRDVTGVDVKICCPSLDLTGSDEGCKNKFNELKPYSIVYTKQQLMGLGSGKLLPEVQQAFNKMKDAAKAKTGLDMEIVSDFRTLKYQRDSLWNKKFNSLSGTEAEKVKQVADYTAVPGLSRHHWGTDIDINSVDIANWDPACVGTTSCNKAVYDWLKQNAAKYGFCQPYDGTSSIVNPEPWHWSYKPISKQLTELHMKEVTAADIKGKNIAGENTIISSFDAYHKGFISQINQECLS